MKYLDYHECAPHCLAKLPKLLRELIVGHLESVRVASGDTLTHGTREYLNEHARHVRRNARVLRELGEIDGFELSWACIYADTYHALYSRWHGEQDEVLSYSREWPGWSDWRGWLYVLDKWRKPLKEHREYVCPFVEIRERITKLEQEMLKHDMKWNVGV